MEKNSQPSLAPENPSNESELPKKNGTWKLPDGIEVHIESGLIKTAAGAVAGGIVGAVLFKSGKGWRGASVAMGVGAAIGSTVERAMADPRMK